MTEWLKIGAGVLAAVALFVGGYRYAAALYGADIASLREDYATRAAALEEKYRETEKGQAAAIAAAWSERDKARTDAIDLRSDLERVRGEYADLKRRVSAGNARADKSDGKPCRGGAELVSRCSELLARCVGVAQELSVDRDAVRLLLK